jgi:hypothetical protein
MSVSLSEAMDLAAPLLPIDSPIVFDSQMVFLGDYLGRLIDRRKYILHQHKHIISRLQSLFDEIVWGVTEKQTMARDFYEGRIACPEATQ